MTAVRINPINLSKYYQDMKDAYTLELERARLSYDELADNMVEKRSKIVPYVDTFALPIIDYPEFQQNKYINGRLETAAKGMYEDKRNDLEHKHLCFRLVAYAVDLRKMNELAQKIKLYEKCVDIKYNDYRDIVRAFYNKVHEALIIKAHGYRLEGKLGFVCINRVLNTGCKICDFIATARYKKELQAKGIRVWNREEAEFAKANGLEYDAVDARIYKADESWYELALCNCALPRALSYKLHTIDYRSPEIRKYNYEGLIELTGGDKEKICQLPISLKIKLSLCLQVDKIMYTKFIRNEQQTKCGYGSHRWKD